MLLLLFSSPAPAEAEFGELTSTDALAESIAQHQDDPFLVLLTLSHDSLSEPIRIVRNRKAITSRGNSFLAYPFEVELPTDGEEVPSARITIANISRTIGKTLEKLVEPPSCLIEIVLASTPDTVERSWDEFSFTQVSWDAMRMTATIQQLAYWDEPWPRKKVLPIHFPGLFA